MADDQNIALKRSLGLLPPEETPPEDTGWARSQLGAIARGFVGTLGGIPKGIEDAAAGAYTAVTGRPSGPAVEGYTPSPFYRLGEALSTSTQDILPVGKEHEGSLATTVSGGLGSLAAFVLTGGVARAAGMGAAGATVFTGGFSGISEQMEDFLRVKKEQGKEATAGEIVGAVLGGAVGGASEAVPLGRVFNRFDQFAKGGFKKHLVNAIRGGSEEALQEAFQNTVQNLVASDIIKYDEERSVFEDLKPALIGGGGAGAIVNTLASILGSRRVGRMTKALTENPELYSQVEKHTTTPINPITGDKFETKDLETNFRVLRALQKRSADPLSSEEAVSRSKERIQEIVQQVREKYLRVDEKGKSSANAISKQEANDVLNFAEAFSNQQVEKGVAKEKAATEKARGDLPLPEVTSEVSPEEIATAEEIDISGRETPVPYDFIFKRTDKKTGDHFTFKDEKAAKGRIKKLGLEETHAPMPYGEGFVVAPIEPISIEGEAGLPTYGVETIAPEEINILPIPEVSELSLTDIRQDPTLSDRVFATAKGTPFKTERSAQGYIKRNNLKPELHTITPIEGGFVVIKTGEPKAIEPFIPPLEGQLLDREAAPIGVEKLPFTVDGEVLPEPRTDLETVTPPLEGELLEREAGPLGLERLPVTIEGETTQERLQGPVEAAPTTGTPLSLTAPPAGFQTATGPAPVETVDGVSRPVADIVTDMQNTLFAEGSVTTVKQAREAMAGMPKQDFAALAKRSSGLTDREVGRLTNALFGTQPRPITPAETELPSLLREQAGFPASEIIEESEGAPSFLADQVDIFTPRKEDTLLSEEDLPLFLKNQAGLPAVETIEEGGDLPSPLKEQVDVFQPKEAGPVESLTEEAPKQAVTESFETRVTKYESLIEKLEEEYLSIELNDYLTPQEARITKAQIKKNISAAESAIISLKAGKDPNQETKAVRAEILQAMKDEANDIIHDDPDASFVEPPAGVSLEERVNLTTKVGEAVYQMDKKVIKKRTILDLLGRQGVTQVDKRLVNETLELFEGNTVDRIKFLQYLENRLVPLIKKELERGDSGIEYADSGLFFIGFNRNIDTPKIRLYNLRHPLPNNSNHWDDPSNLAHTRGFTSSDGQVRSVVELQSDYVQNMGDVRELSPEERAGLIKFRELLNKKGPEYSLSPLSPIGVIEVKDLIERTPVLKDPSFVSEQNFRVLTQASITGEGTVVNMPSKEAFSLSLKEVSIKIESALNANIEDDRLLSSQFKKHIFKRLVREEVRTAALQGVSRLRILSAEDLIKVEGWPSLFGELRGEEIYIPSDLLKVIEKHFQPLDSSYVYVKDINGGITAHVPRHSAASVGDNLWLRLPLVAKGFPEDTDTALAIIPTEHVPSELADIISKSNTGGALLKSGINFLEKVAADKITGLKGSGLRDDVLKKRIQRVLIDKEDMINHLKRNPLKDMPTKPAHFRIFKRHEKEVLSFFQSEYGAKEKKVPFRVGGEVQDAVTWYEIDISEGFKRDLPIIAFSPLENYSKGLEQEIPGTTITRRSIVNRFTSGLDKSYTADLDIKFISSLDDIKAPKLREAVSRHFNNPLYPDHTWDVNGLHYPKEMTETGKALVLIFDQKGMSAKELQRVLFHEVVGHYGIQKLFPYKYKAFFEKALRNSALVNEAFTKLRTRWPNIEKRLAPSSDSTHNMVVTDTRAGVKYTVNSQAMANLLEEYVAEVAADYSSPEFRKANTRLTSFARRFFAWVRHILRKAIPGLSNEVYIEDIVAIVAESHDRIMTGKSALPSSMAVIDKLFKNDIIKRDLQAYQEIKKSRAPMQISQIGVSREAAVQYEPVSEAQASAIEMEQGEKEGERRKKAPRRSSMKMKPPSIEKGSQVYDVLEEAGYLAEQQGMSKESNEAVVSMLRENKERLRMGAWESKVDSFIAILKNSHALRYFRSLGHIPFPKAYDRLGSITKGNIERAETMSRQLYKLMKDWNDQQKQAAWEYFTTKDATLDPDVFNAKQSAKLEMAKKEIDVLGARFVAVGALKPEVWEENRGTYLPTRYYKYLDKYGGSGKRTSLRDYLRKQTDLTEEEKAILGEIKDPSLIVPETIATLGRDVALLEFTKALNETENIGWVLESESFNNISFNNKKVSLEWLNNERDRISKELVDPVSGPLFRRTPETQVALEKQLVLINEAIAESKKIFEDRVTELLRRQGASEEEITSSVIRDKFLQDDYIRMPRDPRLGFLSGAYVRKEIKDDFEEAYHMYDKENVNILRKIVAPGGTIEKGHQYWKAMKVPLNPPTWIRNMVGNFVLLDISSDTNIVELSKMVIEEAKSWATGKPSKYWEFAHKRGAFGTTFAANELFLIQERNQERLKKALTQTEKMKYGLMSKYFIPVHKGMLDTVEAASAFYGGIEGLFKTVRMRDHIQQWEKQNNQKFESQDATTQDVILTEAMHQANKAIFDYSKVPPVIRELRRTPLGAPFITFAFKSIPASIEALARRPQKFLKYLMLPYILSNMAQAVFDWDDEDIEQIMRDLPIHMKNASSVYVLPVKDSNGKVQFVDFGYFVPWGMPFSSMQSLMYDFDTTAPTFSAAKSVVNLAMDFGVLGGPLPQTVSAFLTNKDSFTNQPIVREVGTSKEKSSDIMAFLWNLWVPSFMSEHGVTGRMFDQMGISPRSYMLPPYSKGKELGVFGEDRETVGQSLARGVGLNVTGVDPRVARYQNTQSLRAEKKIILTERSKIVRDRNLSPQEKVSKLRTISERLKHHNLKSIKVLQGE